MLFPPSSDCLLCCGEGVMHLAKAMEEGCLPKLKTLCLNHVGMTDTGALALAEVQRWC